MNTFLFKKNFQSLFFFFQEKKNQKKTIEYKTRLQTIQPYHKPYHFKNIHRNTFSTTNSNNTTTTYVFNLNRLSLQAKCYCPVRQSPHHLHPKCHTLRPLGMFHHHCLPVADFLHLQTSLARYCYRLIQPQSSNSQSLFQH